MTDDRNFDAVIKSLVRFHHWTPQQLSEMYIDDEDYLGLLYWYEDLKDYDKEVKKSIKT